MHNIWQKIGGLVLALFLLAVLSGCTSKMKKFNVVVTADQSISDKTVEIDLVGVNLGDVPMWNSIKMSEYWTQNNTYRENALKYDMKFVASGPSQQTLKKNDNIWKLWSSNRVTHLFIMAHLPGVHDDRVGIADDRRTVVRLEKVCWGMFAGKIEIKVNSANVTCITQPPKCPIE
ncbi:hypothetical protein ACFL02_01215 [Planctomycetota bacterium]